MLDRFDADVYFMTGHRAKGLEFDHVYVAPDHENPVDAVAKDGTPRYKTTGDIQQEVNEQIVGTTRAKKTMVLTSLS